MCSRLEFDVPGAFLLRHFLSLFLCVCVCFSSEGKKKSSGKGHVSEDSGDDLDSQALTVALDSFSIDVGGPRPGGPKKKAGGKKGKGKGKKK